MHVLDLLAPIFLIIALGAGLRRIGLLADAVVEGVNKLLYWVGLPAAVFHALVAAGPAGGGAGWLLAMMAGATLLNAGLSWLEAPWLGVKPVARGTFVQAAFRGNLSFIGLPLLLSVPGVPVARTMLAFAPMLILHNALTVWVLLASRDAASGRRWRSVMAGIASNSIILASVAGLIANAAGWAPPVAVMSTLQALARMALPLALLCIGATLMSVPVRGNRRLPVLASLHKVVLSPILGYAIGRLVGLDAGAMLAGLICLACPTAAVSFTMVKQLGGDEGLAATAVVYSALASAVVLALVIAGFM